MRQPQICRGAARRSRICSSRCLISGRASWSLFRQSTPPCWRHWGQCDGCALSWRHPPQHRRQTLLTSWLQPCTMLLKVQARRTVQNYPATHPRWALMSQQHLLRQQRLPRGLCGRVWGAPSRQQRLAQMPSALQRYCFPSCCKGHLLICCSPSCVYGFGYLK